MVPCYCLIFLCYTLFSLVCIKYIVSFILIKKQIIYSTISFP